MATINPFMLSEQFDAHTENRLTSAYMSLLNLSPTALNLFYSQIYEATPIDQRAILEEPLTVSSFPADIISQTSSAPRGNVLISVLITNKLIETNHSVRASERRGIFDGTISVGSEESGYMGIIIENKPDHNNVWWDQLNPGSNSQLAEDVQFVDRPAVLDWKQIIKRLMQASNSRLTPTAEAAIMRAFIDFVLQKQPRLHPYDSFTMCQGNHQLIMQRLIDLLKGLFGDDKVVYHHGWLMTVRTNLPYLPEIGFKVNPEPHLSLHVISVFCTSLTTTRHLFNQLGQTNPDENTVSQCSIRAGHIMGRYVTEFNSHLKVREFINYFKSHRSAIVKHEPADGALRALQQLAIDRIIEEEGIDQALTAFSEKIENKGFVTLCPQVVVEKQVAISELEAAEKRGQDAINHLLFEVFNSGLSGMGLKDRLVPISLQLSQVS